MFLPLQGVQFSCEVRVVLFVYSIFATNVLDLQSKFPVRHKDFLGTWFPGSPGLSHPALERQLLVPKSGRRFLVPPHPSWTFKSIEPFAELWVLSPGHKGLKVHHSVIHKTFPLKLKTYSFIIWFVSWMFNYWTYMVRKHGARPVDESILIF